MIELKCDCCGKSILKKKSHITNKNYCSRDCHNLSMQNGRIVNCSICGEEVYKSKGNIRTRNFCSTRCRNLWLSENGHIMNPMGKSAGHKAPHLTSLNKVRNPLMCISKPNADNPHKENPRKTMSEYLGRQLLSTEDVHHVNGDRTDNRIQNLVVMEKKKHLRMHMKMADMKLRLKGGADG